jgi:DNA (cytosine-5)-methyltransferase 1
LGIATLKSLELFAGAGGLSLGLHQAGFHHEALVEWNPHAVKTLKLNCTRMLDMRPDQIIEIDAREYDLHDHEERIDLLAGGPPCQPFSTSGKNLAHLDQRDMFPVFLESIKTIRPKSILIENVKGLLRNRFKEYFEYILLRIQFPFAVNGKNDFVKELKYLRKLGNSSFPDHERYEVAFQLIDTADYGVPQRRERVFITAFRADLGVHPRKINTMYSKESLLQNQFVTGEYWNQHNITPHNYLGPRDRGILARMKEMEEELPQLRLKPWRTVRDMISDLPSPVERGVAEQIPNHVQHPGARIYTGHIGSYHDYPAKALKAGTHGTPGGENMLRINNSNAVRYFTTREAARLHTFPDEWRFNGETWGAAIKQLGNAVPVSIGKMFGDYLYESLTSSEGE